MSELTLRRSPWSELDPATAYSLLRLRVDVFVVEQQCPYPELDGRDLEPDAEQVWYADEAGAVLACLRVLTEPDGVYRIGRVATATSARGAGLAQRLVADVVDRLGGAHDLVLEAQAHLEHVYARHGFAVSGPGYVEDGIPHVPMVRPAA